jgi:membrane protein
LKEIPGHRQATTLARLAKRILSEFFSHHPFHMAAALSYYTLLSLAPLLLVIVGVAGLVFGHAASSGQLIDTLQKVLGPQSAQAIQSIMEHANKPGSGLISTVSGIIILLFASTTVFVNLQFALHRIWGVAEEDTRSVLYSLLRDRLFSLVMVFGLGLILLISLFISAALSGVQHYLPDFFPNAALALRILNLVISLLLVTVVTALIFYFLPKARTAWRHVWLGAFITSLLFVIGKYIIGFYLGRAGISSIYGAAGSVVVLMIWVFYASLIFFFGAEITHVTAEIEAERQKKPAQGAGKEEE